jgi:hypothetical protein
MILERIAGFMPYVTKNHALRLDQDSFFASSATRLRADHRNLSLKTVLFASCLRCSGHFEQLISNETYRLQGR